MSQKIGLRYTGSDEREIARLKATDGVLYVEPVDAREILATPGNEYEPDKESAKLLGVYFEPRTQGLSVPQLQSGDEELQTGLSHEKYGRSQVVKAVPDGFAPTAMRPMTTTGRPLSLDAARDPNTEDGRGDARFSQQDGPGAPASEGLTKDELKAELDRRGVQYERDANKAELADLLDKQPPEAR
jgi:hypothetical protein